MQMKNNAEIMRGVVFDEKEWNNVTCSATGADTVYRMRRKESASKGREWVSDRG